MKSCLSAVALTFLVCAPFVSAQEPTEAPAPARDPAILFIGAENVMDRGLATELREKLGWQVTSTRWDQLTWGLLRRFNAVVLLDFSRLDPESTDRGHLQISPEAFESAKALIARYLDEGGGVYVLGASYMHMGSVDVLPTLNAFLEKYGAKILSELFRDPSKEHQQETGMKGTYALADAIAKHPATEGVRHWWYIVGNFANYGSKMYPLAVDSQWTPLVASSTKFKSEPIIMKQGNVQSTEAKSAVPGNRATLFAAREAGAGRMILNGGESTVSLIGYAYSPHADKHYGRIGMEAGLNGIPSDGKQLFLSSLRWLMEPSLTSGNLGGFKVRKKAAAAENPSVIPWSPQAVPPAPGNYFRGIFGARPDTADTAASVKAWKAAAIGRGLDFIVFALDFKPDGEAHWRQLQEACAAASDEAFTAVAGIVTHDEFGNSFLMTGSKAWPLPDVLSPTQPDRVRNHLAYWMTQANFPIRVAFDFGKGTYPPWLHSGFSAFGVHTWKEGRLVDEAFEGFLDSSAQGDRALITSVSLLDEPTALASVKEWTWVRADNHQALAKALVAEQFSGGALSFVSQGPKIVSWGIENSRFGNKGFEYAPGAERWRAVLRATSETPLKEVVIYNGTAVYRRIPVSGTDVTVQVDGAHDSRVSLVPVVEDTEGRKAIGGGIDTADDKMWQIFCSDRCNIMSGGSMGRIPGQEEPLRMGATNMLYKAGRLYVATTSSLDNGLPGMDGSGGGAVLSMQPNLFITSESEDTSEERSTVHKVIRAFESGDAIVYETPILFRTKVDESEVYGHAPYVPIEEPRIRASLTQTHFFRNPGIPSSALADLWVEPLADATLRPGWHGLSIRYAGGYGHQTAYQIVRADGTVEDGEPGPAPVRWRLAPGDSVYYPELGEGFFLMKGNATISMHCYPEDDWFRMSLGDDEVDSLTAGQRMGIRIAMAQVAEKGTDGLPLWESLAKELGLRGPTPGKISLTQGKVDAPIYPTPITAANGLVEGNFDTTALKQRMALEIGGLNPHSTAFVIEESKRTYRPIGFYGDRALVSLPIGLSAQALLIGNLVHSSSPDLRVTVLPLVEGESVKTSVDVYNPSDQPVTAKLTVPRATFLAKAQEIAVTLAPHETKVLPLE